MKEKMIDLIQKLNLATLQYDKGTPVLSDEEWDDMYFELMALEMDAGFALPDSPTQVISYQVMNQLEKVEHNHKMLSLAKTKDLSEVTGFLARHNAVAMCKMDGLTCSLRYVDGKLVSAETRGNGFIGEGIFHNAMVIPSIPKRIKYKDELVVDGEVICTYNDFEFFANEYKNPRNFAAGSIRLLDSKECAERRLQFIAWDVLKGLDEIDTLNMRLNQLSAWGFTTVPRICLSADELKESILENVVSDIKHLATKYSYPIDGIVFKFDDVKYGLSLGETSHHFKNAIAFKFYDEAYGTQLLRIEWTMGRTGVLTPIAVFEAIDIDGSTVERASLHNVSIMKETLGDNAHVGQKVEVYKANMIIPQVAENFTKSANLVYPQHCPACGGATEIRMTNDVKALYCTNPLCSAKKIKLFSHFVSRDAMNVDGLSEATLDKMIEKGFLKELPDLFHLADYADEIMKMEGFGKKSCDNLIASIEKSRDVMMPNFIFSLGILNIGLANAKLICKEFDYNLDAIRNASLEDLTAIGGIGEVIARTMMDYFDNEHNKEVLDLLLKEVNLLVPEAAAAEGGQSLEGKVFVVTGSVNHFKNRKELQAKIEELGGKVTGSVTSKTDYLINNDNTSSSSKNKKAKELNIPIITEEEFLQMI